MADVTTTTQDMSLDDVLASIDGPEPGKSKSLMADFGKTDPVFDEPLTKDDKDKDADKGDDKDKGADVDKGKDKDKATKDKKDDKKDDKKGADDKDKGKDDKKDDKKVDDIVDTVFDDDDDDKDKDKDKKTDSSLTTKVLAKLIESKKLLPFDDDKPLEEYSAEDIEELLLTNMEHVREQTLSKEIPEFFQSLPQEIQYAAQYVANGGEDLKGLFKALAATEEIKTLDTKTAKGQESTIREYYRAMDWGTDEEIEEEIERVKELGEKELEKQANKFQPKLQKMHEEVVQGQLARQAKQREAAERETQSYMKNAFETIKPAKLGDVNLNKKQQLELYNGLTQMSYQTRKGTPTNELGALLEKYQFTEPDFNKIYKALWLLKDEEGFFEAYGRKIKNDTASDTARKLKTDQGKGASTATTQDTADDKTTRTKLPRRTAPSFMSGLKGS